MKKTMSIKIVRNDQGHELGCLCASCRHARADGCGKPATPGSLRALLQDAAEKRLAELTPEQQQMFLYIGELLFRGEFATTEEISAALTWPAERVQRVGRELNALGLTSTPRNHRS